MFILQLMHAERIVKVLNCILRVRNYEKQDPRNAQLRREVKVLEIAAATLKELAPAPNSSLEAIEKQLAALQEKHKQYFLDIEVLRKFDIAPGEYEEKFQLLSDACLRIGHGSVKPPQWEAAAA